ncbi:MAG TPA: serine/threonine protein kinase [Gammaproteobacteria bacterium]
MNSDLPTPHPYEALLPDTVLDAVEAQGFSASGALLALNSYENRVYQIGLNDGSFVVAKFYRPGRWSEAAILEEHAFALELIEAELPVVAPLRNGEGSTLHQFSGFRYALYPRRGGRFPDLEIPDTLLRLGHFLGRLHLVGERTSFRQRPAIDSERLGSEPRHFLLAGDFIPEHYRPEYRELSSALLQRIDALFGRGDEVKRLRLHGDFHPGNILWTDRGAHIVDLDDCATGPAVQDLWMLLSGERHEQLLQLDELLAGYEEFRDFDRRELRLIEPLRTLRLMHYAAWLARRWDDPAFPLAFPWFNTPSYWEGHILTLREQLRRLDEPPLSLY